MKTASATALGLLLGLASTLACAEHYGAPITLKHPVALETAVKQVDGKPVLIESKVAKVCEQRGCWLGLQSANGELHVTFKDEAFFVPASLIGKTVLVEGKMEKVADPSEHYELVASGIDVKI